MSGLASLIYPLARFGPLTRCHPLMKQTRVSLQMTLVTGYAIGISFCGPTNWTPNAHTKIPQKIYSH